MQFLLQQAVYTMQILITAMQKIISGFLFKENYLLVRLMTH
jgi:hypothetical protein